MGFKDEIFAVVDLETTGSSYRNGDRIIQIGIALVQHHSIIQEYDFMVNPGKKIPVMIEQLTGISNNDVKDAPYFEDLADYIFNLLDGCVFVAHNIGFDYRFLNQSFKAVGLPELTIPGIDTVELSKVLYPTMDSYRLSDLSKQLLLTHDQVHNAAGDARATAELFIAMQKRAISLPLVTLEKLYQLSGHTQKNQQEFFEACLAMSRDHKQPLSENIYIANGIALRHKKIANEQTDYRLKDSYNIERLWEAIKAETGLSSRMGQADMMQQIESFLLAETRTNLAIEAPAGFGKTLAYMIPAILTANPDHKVVLSTSTLLLQEQLESVLLNMQQFLPFSFSYATLSSKRHFISLAKVDQIDLKGLYGTDALVMMSLFVWLTETETGNMLELSTSHHSGSFLATLGSDTEYEENEQKWSADDFKNHYQRKAKLSSILITNHAYLTHHFEDIGQLVSNDKLDLVVDEAHRLAAIYKEKERVSLNVTAIKKKILKFTSAVRSYREHLEQHAKTGFPQYELINFEFTMDQMIHVLEELEAGMQTEFRDDHDGTQTDSFVHPDFIQSNWFTRLTRKFLLHSEELGYMLERYLEIEEVERENQFTKRLKLFVKAMNNHAAKFNHFLITDCFSYYAIKKMNGLDTNAFAIEKGYWDIGEKLQSEMQATFAKVIYISATLQLETQSDFFSHKIGLQNLETISYTSKFEDEDKKIEVRVPVDLPAVSKLDRHEWTDILSSFIFNLVQQSNKKILVLFNSNKVLEEVLIKLRNKNEQSKLGIDFLAQGFSGSQRRVHRRFLESEQAVLLGSGAYWEGVDFPDQPVEILVMTRLPFDPPNTPENRAIEIFYRENGRENPFKKEMLPKMILRFIQGMGRISRKSGQQGLLFCLDSRLTQSPYSKQIIASLPSNIDIHEMKFAELID